MSLINIEYGSLASSETMNKNFEYLEKKISDNTDSIMTSISSILSNIATINSRLADISEVIVDNNSDLNAKIDEYKNKTKILVQESSMVPHWNGCTSITINNNYTATRNGFLLIIPNSDNSGYLKVNSTLIENTLKSFLAIPIKKGDVVVSTLDIHSAFFLPITEINIENF